MRATSRGRWTRRSLPSPDLRIEIVRRSGPKGWELLPRRWVIERSFAWFGRNRRLARDYEGLVAVAADFIHLASIQLLIRRAARS